jgi:hypothetical protein
MRILFLKHSAISQLAVEFSSQGDSEIEVLETANQLDALISCINSMENLVEFKSQLICGSLA